MRSQHPEDTIHEYQGVLGKQLYDEIIYKDGYKMLEFFRQNTGQVFWVIDIGANVGYFTLQSSVLYPYAKKLLVEPNNLNVELLKDNFSDFKNIFIEASAFGDRTPVSVKPDKRWSGSDSYVQDTNGNVKSMTLEDLFDKYNVSGNYILKMDCEGAEVYLKNTPTDIFKNCLYFISEFHEDTLKTNDLTSWEKWLNDTFFETHTISKIKNGIDSGNGNALYSFFVCRKSIKLSINN